MDANYDCLLQMAVLSAITKKLKVDFHSLYLQINIIIFAQKRIKQILTSCKDSSRKMKIYISYNNCNFKCHPISFQVWAQDMHV